jgi:hypothetical protein
MAGDHFKVPISMYNEAVVFNGCGSDDQIDGGDG